MMENGLQHLLKPLSNYQPKQRTGFGLRGSAVLIPIVDRGSSQLVYTLRAQHLKHHAGQISFPGGRIESNETPLEAALREAHEEIGLPPEMVTPMGRLDDVFSPRGYHVQCYVGLVSKGFKPSINQNEVDRLIQVDMEELFQEHRHETKMWKGIRKVHYFDFDDGMVWGVTGQITWHLREVLAGKRPQNGVAL